MMGTAPRLPPLADLARVQAGQPAPAVPSLGLCPRDGQEIRRHPRCRQCSILVGPGHLEPAVGADGRCPTCQRRGGH